ncbi:hypothetical protein HDV00_006354 [Rhizophlyctis rosea]|nr:hypothetical protein HDV00_006354 [Rhizophlyctis rosea]
MSQAPSHHAPVPETYDYPDQLPVDSSQAWDPLTQSYYQYAQSEQEYNTSYTHPASSQHTHAPPSQDNTYAPQCEYCPIWYTYATQLEAVAEELRTKILILEALNEQLTTNSLSFSDNTLALVNLKEKNQYLTKQLAEADARNEALYNALHLCACGDAVEPKLKNLKAEKATSEGKENRDGTGKGGRQDHIEGGEKEKEKEKGKDTFKANEVMESADEELSRTLSQPLDNMQTGHRQKQRPKRVLALPATSKMAALLEELDKERALRVAAEKDSEALKKANNELQASNRGKQSVIEKYKHLFRGRKLLEAVIGWIILGGARMSKTNAIRSLKTTWEYYYTHGLNFANNRSPEEVTRDEFWKILWRNFTQYNADEPDPAKKLTKNQVSEAFDLYDFFSGHIHQYTVQSFINLNVTKADDVVLYSMSQYTQSPNGCLTHVGRARQERRSACIAWDDW